MSRQRILCIAPLIALCTGVFWSTEAHPSPSGAEMPAAARSTMDVLNACGPNALYVLLKLRNIPVEFDAMRAVADPGPDGLSLLELKTTAASFGLHCSLRRCSVQELSELPLPVIARVRAKIGAGRWHYVVFTKFVNDGRVEAIDGTTGEIYTLRLDKLRNIWDGEILVPTNEAESIYTSVNTFLAASWIFAVVAIVWVESFRRPGRTRLQESQQQCGHPL